MPATITHAYFGNDLFNKLPKKDQNRIKNFKTTLMMFSQSMDSLMFYNIYTLTKGKKIRNLASIFHNNSTNDFFSTLISYINEKKYYNDPKTLVFLYGLIAHFCLDSTAHPYIFYKTGKFDKNDKSTYKYNGYHSYMESYIDNYYLKIRNHNNMVKLNKFCFDLTPFSIELNDTINYTFYKIFNIKNMSKKYFISLKQMKNFITLFRIDNLGIKKLFYKTIDFFTPKNFFPFKSLSYNLDDYSKYNFLNTNNQKWCYPADKNIIFSKSFEQLYEEALNNSLEIIKCINEYFFENKSIDINKLFKNKSYITGLDCNKNKKQRFFEF